MAAFLAQISSLIFGNGGRLEEKNCGSKLNFFFKNWRSKTWCISGENKPESSETELKYFHHTETLDNKQRKEIISCLTRK